MIGSDHRLQARYANIVVGSGNIALLHGTGHRLLALMGSNHRLQAIYTNIVIGSGNIALLHRTGHRLLAMIARTTGCNPDTQIML